MQFFFGASNIYFNGNLPQYEWKGATLTAQFSLLDAGLA